MHDVLHGFIKHVGCLTGFYQIYLTPTNLPPTTYLPTHRPQPTDQPTQYSPIQPAIFYLKHLTIERYRFYRTKT